MMLLALAAVLMLSVTTVFAWPLVFPGDGEANETDPVQARDGDDPPPPPPPPPPPKREKHIDQLMRDLELTKEQKTKVEKIMKDHHEAVRKFMEKEHADVHKKMKAVLTKEQFQTFQKAMKQHHQGPGHPAPKGHEGKERPGKRPPPPPPPPPPDDRD
jgi:hypothetical protein